MPYGRSSVKVYYNTNEDYRDWVLGENIDLFSFDDVDFSRFTFRTIAAPFVFCDRCEGKKGICVWTAVGQRYTGRAVRLFGGERKIPDG